MEEQSLGIRTGDKADQGAPLVKIACNGNLTYEVHTTREVLINMM